MSPEAEHILDWFHLSMKLTVLDQYGKGLVHCDAGLGEEIREKIERLKWSLWHGNLYKAFYKIDDLESLIYNFEETYPKFKPLLKAVEEFRTYIVNNAHLIPNYGERYRNGEAIATGFGVDGEPSREQTLLQKTADAVEQTGRASAVADTRQDAQPRTGHCVQAMVSRYRGRGVA